MKLKPLLSEDDNATDKQKLLALQSVLIEELPDSFNVELDISNELGMHVIVTQARSDRVWKLKPGFDSRSVDMLIAKQKRKQASWDVISLAGIISAIRGPLSDAGYRAFICDFDWLKKHKKQKT